MVIKWIIVAILAVYQLSFNNAIECKMTNLVCRSYNESWFLIHHCRLRALNRHKTVLNFNATVLHPAYHINLEARFLKKASGYKPFLYKVNLDVCQFVNRPYNPVAIIFYRMVKQFTNFNHSCPYMGPQIVDGFHMSYEKFRVPWPGGEFLLEIDWFFDKKRQFSTNIYFTVEENV